MCTPLKNQVLLREGADDEDHDDVVATDEASIIQPGCSAHRFWMFIAVYIIYLSIYQYSKIM